MPEEQPFLGELIPTSRQARAAVGILIVLFCAFFWLGFFVGRGSVSQASAPGAIYPPPPAGERIRLQLAAN